MQCDESEADVVPCTKCNKIKKERLNNDYKTKHTDYNLITCNFKLKVLFLNLYSRHSFSFKYNC